MKSQRVTRKVGINPQSTLLHVVGHCGVKPSDEADILAAGYELVEIDALEDCAIFIYERDVPEKA